MKLSISEAARRAGVDRQVVYRKIKSGAISKGTGEDGKPAVDLSELARIWPHVIEKSVTDKNINSNSLLQLEVRHLRERLAATEKLLEAADRREERLTALLTDQRNRPGAVRRAWNGLFGSGKPAE